MNEAPSTWAAAPVLDVADILDSMRVPVNRTERERRPGPVPYFGATGQVGWIDESLFDEELCLLGEDGAPFLERGKAKAYVIDGPSWVNNHAHVLRAFPGVTTNRYLKYALDHADYAPFVNGTTRLKLTQTAMRHMTIPFAPLNEQRRIVAVIEEQFSRLDAADVYLGADVARLTQLRQQVVDTAGAGHPETRRLEDLLDEPLSNGRSVLTQDGGFPVLRLSALRDGFVDVTASKRGAWDQDEARPFLIRQGDFLVARGNGSRHLVGRGGLVEGEPPPVAFPDTLIRVRVDEGRLRRRFLRLVWDSTPIREQLEQQARTTAGIYKINQSMLRGLRISVPSIAEQDAWVGQVEHELSLIDALRDAIEVAKRRSASLRRAILDRAFRGALVPQDPSDEPASLLLKRIRAEREASALIDRPSRRRSASSPR